MAAVGASVARPQESRAAAKSHGRTLFAPTPPCHWYCGTLQWPQPYLLIANLKTFVGGGVAGSRSDQCPSGALNRTSVPALLDGGARCAPPSADAPGNFRRVAKFPGGYGIRPYANPKFRPRRGQCGGRRKSVKKNAALLHFLAFSLTDHPFGVPRGRAPWAGVRCLGTARLFSLPFLVTKKEGPPEESL